MLFLEKLKQKILSKKINSSSDVEIELLLKTIAEIPLIENKNAVKLITHENEKSAALNAFKNLRTNIQFLCVNNIEDKKVMLVTGATGEEGKSFVTANLAVSFAEIGKKVLIIDGDIKKGKQDKIFNIPNDLGLSNYLSNLDSNGVEINEFLSKFIKETEVRNVNIITSGTVPPNPSELLALPKLEELIKDAKVFFDIIIIDSSKVLEETEALILSRIANSVIIVANYKNTSVENLNNTKKDIQNVGGKILGVVLNKVKLKKEKKTKEQKKEKFVKLKLKIKEKINDVIECIKRKIQESNQKLLEEADKENKTENTDNQIEEKNESKIENKNVTVKVEENNKKDDEEIEDKVQKTFVEKVKEFILPEKNEEIEENIENKEETKKTSKDEKIKEKKKNKKQKEIETIQEDEFKEEIVENEVDKQEIKENLEKNEPKISRFSEFRKTVADKLNNIKEITKNKFENIKESVSEKVNDLKENTIDLYAKSKEYCVQKYNNIKQAKTEENEETKVSETEQEKIKEVLEETEEDFLEEKEEIKNYEIVDDSIKNEKMILIVVDAENGCCRLFSKDYFSEKLIRGIDKKTGHSKNHYSQKNVKVKQEYFIDKYQLTEAQSQRIDVIIYDILKEYDEYLWTDRKIPSDKAENYAICISKDYEFNLDETDKEHTVRAQRLRMTELKRLDIDIEYSLDNLWKTRKINLLDKMQLKKFAKFYEIDSDMKNDSEILKSSNTKKFYSEIIKGAERRLENANKQDQIIEEKQKQAIEEDQKIKQEELKLEQQQFEMEKRAAQERIKIEQENVKAEKKAEQERIKEEKRKEREIEKIERKEENLRKKKEKQKQKEEVKFQKERERIKQMEEAKLEEDIMEDNLYPKTKHNKNL